MTNPVDLVKNLTIVLVDKHTGEIINMVSDGVKDGITIIVDNADKFIKLAAKLILH